jgi:hypothetical protein
MSLSRSARRRVGAAVALALLVAAAVAGGFALRDASREVVDRGADQRAEAVRRLQADRAERERRARADSAERERGAAGNGDREATPSGSRARRSALRRGDGYSTPGGSRRVRRLQRALRRLDLAPRRVASPSGQMVLLIGTGQFGPATERGVRRFQRREGLPVTGIADAETLDRLYAAARPQGRKR